MTKKNAILNFILLYQILNHLLSLVDPILAIPTTTIRPNFETIINTGGKNITVLEKRGINLRFRDRPTGFVSEGDLKNPPGTYPWGVSIGLKNSRVKGNWVHHCGGVIASNYHVITTASCLEFLLKPLEKNLDNLYVRAGDYNLKEVHDEQYIQEIGIASYTVHPLYNTANGTLDEYYDYYLFEESPEHYNDIAVIETKQPFNFANIYVRPIYLPTLEDAEKITKENDTNISLVAAGWGKWTFDNGEKFSSGEQLGDSVIASFGDAYCNSIYNGTRLSKGFTDDVMCGASPLNLAGVCTGDDGSGIVKLDHEKARFVLTGILVLGTDWDIQKNGKQCGHKSKPNIFIRIASKNIISFLYDTIYGIEASYSVEEVDQDSSPSEPEVLLNIYDNCGINTAIDGTYNYNDETNKTGVWPWLVDLRKHPNVKSDRWKHFCGGTILTETHILTAAHCLDPPIRPDQVLKVRAGDADLSNAVDDGKIQESLVKNRFVHPQYDTIKRTRYFDLAILELETPLKFTQTVRPVCLLSLKEAMEISKPDENFLPMSVAGWGSRGRQLEDTIATVFSEETCNQAHTLEKDYRSLVPNLFSPDTMCAGDPAGDSGICHGDSGGGAVHFDQHRGRYVLRAVVSGSASRHCGSGNYPNVYVRLANQGIIRWIFDKMNFQAPNSVTLIDESIVQEGTTATKYTCKSSPTRPASVIKWKVKDQNKNHIAHQKSNEFVEKTQDGIVTISSLGLPKSLKTYTVECEAENIVGSWRKQLAVGNVINAVTEPTTLASTIVTTTTMATTTNKIKITTMDSGFVPNAYCKVGGGVVHKKCPSHCQCPKNKSKLRSSGTTIFHYSAPCVDRYGATRSLHKTKSVNPNTGCRRLYYDNRRRGGQRNRRNKYYLNFERKIFFEEIQ